MSRLKSAGEHGAGGAIMHNTAEIMKGGGSPGTASPGSRLAAFMSTGSKVDLVGFSLVHRPEDSVVANVFYPSQLGTSVNDHDVDLEWSEVAKALGDAGRHHCNDVMDSLQEIMMHDSISVSIEAAKAFGKIGLEHYVLEWCFEQLEDHNPREIRKRAILCLIAMAETFASAESVAAFSQFMSDRDAQIGQLAAEALPRVAVALDDNDTVIEALQELMAGLRGHTLLLAAEALVKIPGGAACGGARNTACNLMELVDGRDWTLSCRAAKCLVSFRVTQRMRGCTLVCGVEGKVPMSVA
jgi:hypothetical protein